MDEIKRIKKSLHLLLLLIPFTVLAAQDSYIIVRAGAEVTLPCDSVTDDHVNCGATDWSFTYSVWTGEVNLFVNRQLDTSEISKSKADRLRLAANCSLVIREVTAEDAGKYKCRQFDLTTQTHEDHLFFISVVNVSRSSPVTEHNRTDEVLLSCFLTPSIICTGVKWLYMNLDVTKNNTDLKTSQSHCSANVSFSKDKIKNYSLLTCKVGVIYNEGTFSFIPPSSAAGNNEMTTDWWWYIRLVVGFAAIVILVVILIRWRRNKIQGGDAAVAFSTVDAPSSSTGPSADPSSLYANVTFIQ
ncbi:uncharacterized protein LOC133015981 [Limanda limanda]|uniref:uncharacterized protein LOC133015981 n=1 Tax=Limanda limanda TaxID=27771 RepID=UPI0029C89DB1|nr:uncharacterized protein LOC133015981 [Limanda limanda]